ncbi:MAG: hypothetical protein AB1497_05540 [Bacillota bacterium]
MGTGPEALRALRLRRLFWFVVQDRSRCSPPEDVSTTRLLSPWECPVRVVLWRFLASCAAVAGLLRLVPRAVALLPGRRAGAGRAWAAGGCCSPFPMGNYGSTG